MSYQIGYYADWKGTDSKKFGNVYNQYVYKKILFIVSHSLT